MTTTADGVVEIVKFCDKSCIGLDEAGNDRERSSLSELMICDFSGIVTESFTIPKIVFSKYIFCENMCLVE